jgi:hypothetical protein
MNTHADKTHENKSQSVANEVSQEQSFGEPTFQFADNRPEAIAQRKLQEMANNSPQVTQLRALQEIADNCVQSNHSNNFSKTHLTANSNTPVYQMATKIKNTPQPYTYNKKHDKVDVGKKMEAWLDKDNPIKGQEAGVNASQEELMMRLRKKYLGNQYKKKAGHFVKGHMLNDNLGGTALNKNLFPITVMANKQHLSYVENKVKARLWSEQKSTYYEVNVIGNADEDTPTATFNTKIFDWPDITSEDKGDLIEEVNIPSNLGTPLESEVAGEHVKESNPEEPMGFEDPEHRYQDLNAQDTEERNAQTVTKDFHGKVLEALAVAWQINKPLPDKIREIFEDIFDSTLTAKQLRMSLKKLEKDGLVYQNTKGLYKGT